METDDPENIRDWIEDHGGKPAVADKGDAGDVKLGIKFEDEDSDEKLKVIPWEDFFNILDEKDLVFAYVQNDGIQLNSEKFDFRNREEANTEMEEPGIFGNTLETPDAPGQNDDKLP